MAYGLFVPSSGSLPNLVRGRIPARYVTGYALTTATKYAGCVFRCNYAENITGVRLFVGNQTGTPSGVHIDLYAIDSNGNPTGSSLANWTGTTSSGFQSYTFSSAYTPSLGTYYAIVVSNATATPGSNYPNLGMNNTGIADNYWSPVEYIRTTDGSTYLHNNGEFAIAPIYATSGVDCIYTVQNSASANHSVRLYSTTGSRQARIAVKVNFPTAVKLWGIGADVGGAFGSPSFNITGEVLTASASVAFMDGFLAAGNNGNQYFLFNSWSGVSLSANTDYYIAVTPVGNGVTAGDNSNAQAIGTTGASGCLSQAPTQGIIKGAYYSTASGSPSWSASTNELVIIEPWFEVLTGSGGGSSSILCQRGMNGGFPR